MSVTTNSALTGIPSGATTDTGAFTPPASLTISNNGDAGFEAVSDTQLNLKYKGSDGNTRTIGIGPLE